MKKSKTQKLVLNSETVKTLHRRDLQQILGGEGTAVGGSGNEKDTCITVGTR
mgnify:CR=1 FL=1